MSETERLVTVWDARFDKIEEKLNKVVRSAYSASGKVEKRLDSVNDNISRKFGRGIGQSFSNELDGLSSRAGRASTALSGFGLAGIGVSAALGAMTIAAGKAIEAMDFGDELQAASDKLQITAESLQALQFAADETDVPIDQLRDGLFKLNGALGALKTGVGGAKVEKVFAALGLTRDDLKGVNDANDLLPILADRLGKVSSTAEQVQLARKLGIENLLPLLRQGSTGLKELEDRARSLGLVLSNETVQGLADSQRQMELASQQIKTNLTAAFSGLATSIAQATGFLADFLVKLRHVGEVSPRTGAMLKDLFLGIGNPGVGIGGIAGDLANRTNLPTKSAAQLSAEMRPIFGRKPAPAGGFSTTFQGDAKGGGRTPKGTKADPIHVEAPEPVGRTDDPGLALLREFEANRELTRRAEHRAMEAVDGFDASSLDVFKNGPTDWINEAAQAAIDAADEAQKAYENSVHEGVLDGLRAAADGNGLDFLKHRLREAMFEAAADALTKAFLSAQANSGGGVGGTILKGIGAFLGFNAGGTDNWRGGLSVVGERGPELVNLPRGAQVIPNDVMRGMGGARGGGGTTVVNQFDMRGAIVEESLYKRMQTIARTEANRAGAQSASFTLGAMPGRLVQQQKLGR